MRKAMKLGALVLTVGALMWAWGGDSTSNNFGASISLPKFDARMSIGFNYDLLRSPTNVSFEHARGFFGFDVPLEQTIDLRDVAGYLNPAADTIFADSTLFTNGEEFRPRAGAKQNPNLSVMVDVPMMGGVASFSNIQNFYLNYSNVLGNPQFLFAPESLGQGISFLLRGTVNVPLNLEMNWETMTFGYAYRLNKNLIFALNLHRHLFSVDVKAKIDADILGRYDIDLSQGVSNNITGSLAPIKGELDYPSDKINGRASGHYEAEVWSTTVGLNVWRFSLTSRFGINTKAHGFFSARYSLPFFIDPQTFQPTVDFTNTEELMEPEVRNALLANATDSIEYKTESDLIWQMPSGHTINFDIIPEHLSVSYTKTFGDIVMKLNNIHRVQVATENNSSRDSTADSLNVDLGISVDNVITLHASLWNAYINLGVFGMDFRYADRSHILGDAMIKEMKLGRMAMLPIVNVGSALGSRMQLLIEIDILPLPALKSGLIYHF